MARLPSKKNDYISSTKDYMEKRGVILTKTSIIWILNKFIHYVLDILIHGHVFTISGQIKFWMYYVNSSDFELIDSEARFARSGAIHGVFFSIGCSGKIPDEYKTDFKPMLKLRRTMENRLDDPDLAYKLIT